MTAITVLRPDRHGDSAEPAATISFAPREALADGAILTLVDNGKTHARPVLDLIGEELQRRLPEIGTIEFVAKSSAGKTISDEVAAGIAARSALAVAALGDCGACSSCSALDAVTLERHGVPSAVVITEPFIGLVERFSAMAGMPGYPPVILPIPLLRAATRNGRPARAGACRRRLVTSVDESIHAALGAAREMLAVDEADLDLIGVESRVVLERDPQRQQTLRRLPPDAVEAHQRRVRSTLERGAGESQRLMA